MNIIFERFSYHNIKGCDSGCGLPSLYTPANIFLSVTTILTKPEHSDISPPVGSRRLDHLEDNITS